LATSIVIDIAANDGAILLVSIQQSPQG